MPTPTGAPVFNSSQGAESDLGTGLPFVIANTGSMGNNGALTLGTALGTTYANAYVYLPASAIFAGSAAGWYFTQFSSATVGVVYNNPYVAGTQPVIPTALVPFVSTGPGAYTGSTSAQVGPSLTLAPNQFGPNAFARVTALYSTNNSVGNKTLQIQLVPSTGVSAVNLYSAVVTTVTATLAQTVLFGRGLVTAQVGPNAAQLGPYSAASAAAFGTSVLGGQGQPLPSIQLTGQLAVATDVLVMEGFFAEVFYNT